MIGERTIFLLSQSILPLTPCPCHASNTAEHIPKYSPIFSPLGRSSQYFSLILLACNSPGKILGKHKQCTDFWWGEITLVPGRFQQNAPAVFDISEAQAESVLHWLLMLLLAHLGLIPHRCPWICLCYEAQSFNCLNAYLHNVHKSVMLKKIYPLINQHSQPPSLGSCPSLFKRRKKLLWKLPQIFFFSFCKETFLYQCINHKNDCQFNSFLWVSPFKMSCQEDGWGAHLEEKWEKVPFTTSPEGDKDQNYSGTTCFTLHMLWAGLSLQHSVASAYAEEKPFLAGWHLWKREHDVLWSAGDQKNITPGFVLLPWVPECFE